MKGAIGHCMLNPEGVMAESKLEDMHQIFTNHFNAGNLDALVELYEEEAAFVPQPGQVVTGKNAIREALQGFLSLNGTMTLKMLYAIRSGDLALLSGEWHLTGSGPEGEPIEMEGKTAEVVRRQHDGRWLYVADHPFGAS